MRTNKYFVVAAYASPLLLLLSLSFRAEAQLPKALPAKATATKSSNTNSPSPSIEKTSADTPQLVTPEAAYMNTYQEEVQQQRKTEELEKKAVKARQNEESKKADLEKEISAKRFQIESYKQKQLRLEAEIRSSTIQIESLEKDLNETEHELVTFRQSADQQLFQVDQQKKDYAQAQKNLEDSNDKLRITKANLTKSLYEGKMEVQRLRAEVAAAESKAEALEAQASNVKADESQVRVQVMAIRTAIQDKNSEIQQLLLTLDGSKRKLDQAKAELQASSQDYKKAEQKKLETQYRVASEVKKFEDMTLAAQKSKSLNEAEKMRIEAETEKLKTYLAMVKKSSNEMIDSSLETQASVMESRLALQTAKSELSQEVASSEKSSFKKDRADARVRQLASQAEASEMIDGAKPWVVSKSCKLHKRASSKSDVVSADISVGQKLIGASYSENWIKVLNSSGAPAFIKKDCGSFE